MQGSATRARAGRPADEPVVRWRAPDDGGVRPRRSVVLYTPSADPSGMGAHMVDLATELVRDRDVTVMAWPTPGGQRVLDASARGGARTFALPRPRDPAFGATVEAFLADARPDVFHLHVGTGREDFDGARAARRAGVPLVVQTQHLPWLMDDTRKQARLHRALRPVHRVITVSDAQRRTYERVGVPSSLMTTVPNGIRARGAGPGRDAARAALGLSPDGPVVLTVGRLTVIKGQRYLVAAVPALVERFPDLSVVLVGDGHLRGELAAQTADLGVERAVRLAGHRSDARELLDAADVFVLPSRSEGMPLAALEAMDAGLPVVATDVIGTSEVVVHGRTGLLVPSQDPAALAEALAALLADPDRRAAFGRAGRARFVERFTSARMAAQTAAVYDQALAELRRATTGPAV